MAACVRSDRIKQVLAQLSALIALALIFNSFERFWFPGAVLVRARRVRRLTVPTGKDGGNCYVAIKVYIYLVPNLPRGTFYLMGLHY